MIDKQHDPDHVTMPFGKYRGLPVATVPRPYLVWCLQTIDLWPNLREAMLVSLERTGLSRARVIASVERKRAAKHGDVKQDDDGQPPSSEAVQPDDATQDATPPSAEPTSRPAAQHYDVGPAVGDWHVQLPLLITPARARVR
jgi:uncharacterized protein (DUF3820 family)